MTFEVNNLNKMACFNVKNINIGDFKLCTQVTKIEQQSREI